MARLILPAAACAYGAVVLVICLGATLSGCPWTVTPITESDCPRRPNCGQCASEAVCVWNTRTERCIGAHEVFPGEETRVVSVLELCPPPSPR